MAYRGHYIVAIETRHAESLKRLYRISGPYWNKAEGQRPFLTSQKAAKEWIDEQRTASLISAHRVGEG